MNEARFIHWISKHLPHHPDLTVGVGDDAAVIRHKPPGNSLIYQADMIVENVHFDSKTSKPSDWGKKAILSNISDIAAMGGKPQWVLVSMGLPKTCTEKKAQSIYQGILKTCKDWGIVIVGGDTCRSQQITLSVMMVGYGVGKKSLTRSGAKVGDVIFVTGELGGSLNSGRHLNFTPRIRESRFLAQKYKVNAMMDLSDGLAKDLKLLANESRVGALIFSNALPLHRDIFKSVSKKKNGIHISRKRENLFFQTKKIWQHALLDGEDYELIFTMNLEESARLLRDVEWKRKKMNFFPIGRILSPKHGCRIVNEKGLYESFPKARDHHFDN